MRCSHIHTIQDESIDVTMNRYLIVRNFGRNLISPMALKVFSEGI